VDEHWEAGMRDMGRILAHPELLFDSQATNGVTTYDLCEEGSAPRVKHPMVDPTDTVRAGRRSGRAPKA
jgi:NTE family protein